MPETTLRNLAKAYSKKNLEHAAYREARAKFINGVLKGDLDLAVNKYPPLLRPRPDQSQEITLRKLEKKSQAESDTTQIVSPGTDRQATPRPEPRAQQPAKPAPASGIHPGLLAGGVAIVLVLVVVLALVIFSGGEDEPVQETRTVTSPAPQPAAPVVEVPAGGDGEALISSFLGERNWSNNNLDEFISDWYALPGEARQAAMGSIEIGILANEIHKQLLEERALSGISDNPQAEAKQQKLIEFAAQVGIQDPRLK